MEEKLSNKTVCHVTSVHPWDDIRIYKKEAISAAKFTKETFLVAVNAPNKRINNVQIIGVAINGSIGRIYRMLFVKKKVIAAALKLNADIYHLHDPELLTSAKKLLKKGKSVVYDSHEDVPNAILSKNWIRPAAVRRMISKWYNNFEKSICKQCDGVISVLPEITEKFNNPHKQTLYNYPLANYTNDVSKLDGFTLIYVGGLTRIRGIKEICAALELLPSEVELILVGKWESEEFRNECLNQIKDKNRVKETGFIGHEQCQEYIQRAHVGLATLYKEPNYLRSLPIKAFEYAINELPVLMSDIPYWQNEFGSFAEFTDPLNINEIVTKILQIKASYEEYCIKVQEYKKTELSHKTWENEELKLKAFYEEIIAAKQ